jgi:hypothetical protein
MSRHRKGESHPVRIAGRTVRFALLETKEQIEDLAPTLELVLSTGERLRIGNNVNAATLRVVLEAVRG